MNDTELATLMLEWLRLNGEMKLAEDKIRADVMARKQSFTTGKLTAKYFAGRRSLDWVTPALREADPHTLRAYTETTVTTDYELAVTELLKYVPEEISGRILNDCEIIHERTDHKAVCKELDIPPDVLSEGTPSVTFKVKED
jgi:hypothetical protein